MTYEKKPHSVWNLGEGFNWKKNYVTGPDDIDPKHCLIHLAFSRKSHIKNHFSFNFLIKITSRYWREVSRSAPSNWTPPGWSQNHSFEWSMHCFSESRFIWISINVKQKSRKNDGPLCKNGAKTSQKFWHAIGAAAKIRRPVWDYIIHIYPRRDLSIFAPFRVLFSIFALIFAPPQKFCKKNLRLLKNALYF